MLRIPLWIVAVPLATVIGLSIALRLLWNSPWSPQRLRERLDLTLASNDRVQSELQRGESGLLAARRAIQLDALERDKVRGMAGIRPSKADSATVRGGIFSRDSVPNVGALLAQARSIRQGYDQMIDWFQRHPAEVGSLPTIRPILADHPLVGDFGSQTDPFTGQAMSFPGLTWEVPVGTPVWATGAGVVVVASEQPRWGKYVEIRHDDRVVTMYTHLSRVDVKEDDAVNRGQVIGLSGQSGKVIAPAVFYAVFLNGIPIDPSTFLLPESQQPKPKS